MAPCTLNWSPATNNVESCGGLPEEICRAATHIMANGGGDRSRSIAAAVNFVKFVCATGKSKNFAVSNPSHTVDPAKRARACANVAKWKALVACMKGKPRITGKALEELEYLSSTMTPEDVYAELEADLIGLKGDEPRSKKGARELDAVLFNIDILDLSDKYNESTRFADIAPPPGSIGDPTTTAVKAIGECHMGSCEIPRSCHEIAEFEGGAEVKAVAEDENGIWIEGFAADLDIDREDEAFEEAALSRAVKTFERNPILTYHHSSPIGHMWHSGAPWKMLQFGEVKTMEFVPGKGLRIKAYIPKPEYPLLLDAYNNVKAGRMKGLSVGGKFWRHNTPEGTKVHRADIMEVAVTPRPMQPGALIEAVHAAKSAEGDGLIWHPLSHVIGDGPELS